MMHHENAELKIPGHKSLSPDSSESFPKYIMAFTKEGRFLKVRLCSQQQLLNENVKAFKIFHQLSLRFVWLLRYSLSSVWPFTDHTAIASLFTDHRF